MSLKKGLDKEKFVVLVGVVLVFIVVYSFGSFSGGLLGNTIKVFEEESTVENEIFRIFEGESERRDFLILGLIETLEENECLVLRAFLGGENVMFFDVLLDEGEEEIKSLSYQEYFDFVVVDDYIAYRKEGLLEEESFEREGKLVRVEYYVGGCL